MELLFLLLLVPIAWLMLLPRRVAGAVRRFRMPTAGILAGILLLGFVLMRAAPPAAEPPTDYTLGDTALRALIE